MQTIYLFVLFFAIRLLSFLFAGHAIAQAFVVFSLLLVLGVVYFKNPGNAWFIILGEVLLGGAGHFFEFFGLSLRTILISTFLVLWVTFTFSNSQYRSHLKVPNKLFWVFIPLFLIVHMAAFIGLLNGHDLRAVIADLIPYTFLFLLLPTYRLFGTQRMQDFLVRALIVFIIGSALYALFTFVMFRFGIFELQDPFYKWYRDVSMGKITMVTDHFFRIVLPEHLLIPPAVLVIMSLLMRDEKHHYMWRFLIMCCMFILALNLSRAYMLGVFVGTFVLLYRHKMVRWLKVSAWSAVVFLALFSGTYFISSLGSSFGLPLLGLRIGSFVEPSIEESTLTRMQLLDPIFQKISEHPFLGNGLGASISFINPTTFQPVTTTQFDWGYLELLAEIGPIGLLYIVITVCLVIWEGFKKISHTRDHHDLKVGLMAGLIALMIINITSPALFHVFGIFYIVFVTAFFSKPLEIFDSVTTVLYRIFNRKSS